MARQQANFKIETATWERFKSKAGNASEVLKQLIAAYLVGDISEQDLTSLDRDYQISGLESRVEALEQWKEQFIRTLGGN